MAAESTLTDSPGTLSGVARVLVNAGKLTPRSAEEHSKNARERKATFVSTVVGAGASSPTTWRTRFRTRLRCHCWT